MIGIFDKVKMKTNGKIGTVLDICELYGVGEDHVYLVEADERPEGALLKDILYDCRIEELEKIE